MILVVMFIRNVWLHEMVMFFDVDYVFRSEGEVGILRRDEEGRTLIEFDGDEGYIYPHDSYIALPPMGDVK